MIHHTASALLLDAAQVEEYRRAIQEVAVALDPAHQIEFSLALVETTPADLVATLYEDYRINGRSAAEDVVESLRRGPPLYEFGEVVVERIR
jgi:hypothetical protein